MFKKKDNNKKAAGTAEQEKSTGKAAEVVDPAGAGHGEEGSVTEKDQSDAGSVKENDQGEDVAVDNAPIKDDADKKAEVPQGRDGDGEKALKEKNDEIQQERDPTEKAGQGESSSVQDEIEQVTSVGGEKALAILVPIGKLYSGGKVYPQGVVMTRKTVGSLMQQAKLYADIRGLPVEVVEKKVNILCFETESEPRLYDGHVRRELENPVLKNLYVIPPEVIEDQVRKMESATGQAVFQIFYDEEHNDVMMTGANSRGEPVIVHGFKNLCRKGYVFNLLTSQLEKI